LVSSLFAPVAVTTALLPAITHDDHNKENEPQELLLASSSFSKLKIAAATKPLLEDNLSKSMSLTTPSLVDDSYNHIHDTIAGEPSAVIEDDDYNHHHYYYDYHDQQDDYSIYQYDVGISFLNEKLNNKEEVEHYNYNDRHYQQKQQQHDERRLSSICATACSGTRPVVNVDNHKGVAFKNVINDCIGDTSTSCPYSGTINCWNTSLVSDMSQAFSSQ
jgi:hypothetical protein